MKMAPSKGVPRRTRAVAIVPARLSSTRLARKMLLRETGRFLFEHTAANAARASSLERVVVATDSEEILEAAASVGIEALLTSPAHASGTDRVHEALELLTAAGAGPFDVVVNIQGDEPELDPADVDTLCGAFADPAVETATLWAPIEDARELNDPSVVKVVLAAGGDALYFSRAPIPATAAGVDPGASGHVGRRHLGVYAFRPDALRRFCSLPRGALERRESLEQLRWLEAGGRMRVLEAKGRGPGIDTAEHYAAFKARERERAR